MQHVQHGNAEVKCSMGRHARVHAREDVGELDAVDAVVCGATRVLPTSVVWGERALWGLWPRRTRGEWAYTSDIVLR